MLNKKREVMEKNFLVVISLVFLSLFIPIVSAVSDVSVFQGQYYIGEELQQGTFEFNFNIYDGETGGTLVYSDTQNLSTGFWGQWRAELEGVSSASNDTTKDYFMEITIDGNVQGSRKRLTHFNYLRKDIDEVTSGDISSSGRIGAEEYTYVPSEGNSILDSFFNFVSPSGGNLIRISPREDFLGFSNTTSIFIISDNESYVGMTHFISPINGLPNSWLWTDIHNGDGGFALIDTENLSVGKEYVVKGVFADDRFSLGGVSNNPQGESSAGMDFIIYKDANGTTAFFVDSANSYATTIDALLNVTDTAYFYDAYVNGTKICLEDGTNCLNISGNEVVFTGWDKNESDDFSGSWSDLLGVPSGFSDNIDNNTIYTSGDGNISIVGTVITFIGNLFSGSWNDLTDVPGGFADGIDNDTRYTHLSNFIDDLLWTIQFNNTGDSRWLDDTTIGNCSGDGSCGLITYDSELSYTVDTSASVDCAGDQVLLGNGSCLSSSTLGGGTDTSAATECTGTELLLGNGSCMNFPTIYVSFISTVDGDLKKNEKYLPLGTDSPISGGEEEASWIIDRDLTFTGILWNAKSNDRTDVSEVILSKSTSDKNSFSDTSLSVDIQGSIKGSQTGFSVSFSQGDLAVIKYDSSGGGQKIKDLSITLIGTYD